MDIGSSTVQTCRAGLDCSESRTLSRAVSLAASARDAGASWRQRDLSSQSGIVSHRLRSSGQSRGLFRPADVPIVAPAPSRTSAPARTSASNIFCEAASRGKERRTTGGLAECFRM